MRISLTRRRLAVLTAVHQHGPCAPSGICHATDYGPGTVYAALDTFERAGWIGRTPDPTRRGVSVYHLTPRGQTGAGLQPPQPTT